MSNVIDLKGQRFGKLKVIELSHSNKHRKAVWKCKCDCGKYSYIVGQDLRRGKTRSCGCTRDPLQKNNNNSSRLYRIWNGMKNRCTNKNVSAYKYYGGRGIVVCEEWNNSFLSFQKWAIENGYSDNLTIDRIDANGNYEQDNCRFITMKEQLRNTRKTIKIKYKGIEYCLKDLSKKFHFSPETFKKYSNEFKTDEETIDYILSKHKEAYYGK